MRKTLAILCLLITFAACKTNYTTSKNIISVEKAIDSYSSISVAGLCNLIYKQKTDVPVYLRFEIEESLKDRVKIDVKNNTLRIALDGRNVESFKVYTNSPSLSLINIAGSSNVILLNEVKTQSMTVAIAGSGDFKAENIQCKDLNISITGSGNAVVAGRATHNNISIQGSGGVEAFALITKTTKCSISGSGNTKVYATEELRASVNGSGSVEFKGNPKEIKKSVQGSGSISGI